jgi:ABC-type multidrug transport system ATPase subunit
MIELINIKKSFGGQNVLKNISATFDRGVISVIMGRSGEGKTVLTKSIVGLTRVDSGRIIFDGEDILLASVVHGLGKVQGHPLYPGNKSQCRDHQTDQLAQLSITSDR